MGMIADWDMFEQVLDYSYKKIIQSQSEYHPVLFSEAPWNKKDRREQLCEIMFEKYNVPAFFLVKNAVLSSFANGRSTALVIDSGSMQLSSLPWAQTSSLGSATSSSRTRARRSSRPT